MMRKQMMFVVLSVCSSVVAAQETSPPVKAKVPADTKAQTPQPATPTFDGTRWWVEVTPDAAASKAGDKAFVDVFAFADKKVTLTACEAYGFRPSIYTTTAMGAAATRLATRQASDTSGSTAWDAEITGDNIRGKLTWTKTDGKVANFTFAGKKSTVLEGTSWELRLSPQHDADEDADETPAKSSSATLKFHKGELELRGEGVGSMQPCAYTLAKSGDAWRLDAQHADKGGSEVSLRATINGASIRGSLTVTDSEGEATKHSFEGTRTQAAAARPAR